MTKTTFSIPNEFINNCICTFPNENQMDILQEECAELIKACSKLKRKDISGTQETLDRLANLKEEIAHVLISSAVVAHLYNITEEDVLAEVEKKQIKYGFPVYKQEYASYKCEDEVSSAKTILNNIYGLGGKIENGR